MSTGHTWWRPCPKVRTDPRQPKINSPMGDAEEKPPHHLMAGTGETRLAGSGSFLGGEAGLSPE